MTCYRQTCTQIITGRNLKYRRALKVIQNEEYLMVTDLEIIRRLYEGVEFKSNQIRFCFVSFFHGMTLEVIFRIPDSQCE